MQTKLIVVCMYCQTKVDVKEGWGVTGETSTICRECWNKKYPDIDYPGKKLKEVGK